MVKAFELVRLGEEDVKAKFPAMYNAFCYGAPPHAGIAPGVDRMVMLLAGEDSIREIIPFPMNKNAQDVMMGAPSDRRHRSSWTSCILPSSATWRRNNSFRQKSPPASVRHEIKRFGAAKTLPQTEFTSGCG